MKTYTSAVATGLTVSIINHSAEFGTYLSGELELSTQADLDRNLAHFHKIGWRVYLA